MVFCSAFKQEQLCFSCHLCVFSFLRRRSSPRPLPLFLLHPSLPRSPPALRSLHLPLWRRGGSEKMGVEVVGWCLGIEQKGAWLPVCLGALNESMIHGTRGSHRDRIRGALSKHSPETGKRYLICPPRQQLPLRVRACVRACVCERGRVFRRPFDKSKTPKIWSVMKWGHFIVEHFVF